MKYESTTTCRRLCCFKNQKPEIQLVYCQIVFHIQGWSLCCWCCRTDPRSNLDSLIQHLLWSKATYKWGTKQMIVSLLSTARTLNTSLPINICWSVGETNEQLQHGGQDRDTQITEGCDFICLVILSQASLCVFSYWACFYWGVWFHAAAPSVWKREIYGR